MVINAKESLGYYLAKMGTIVAAILVHNKEPSCVACSSLGNGFAESIMGYCTQTDIVKVLVTPTLLPKEAVSIIAVGIGDLRIGVAVDKVKIETLRKLLAIEAIQIAIKDVEP